MTEALLGRRDSSRVEEWNPVSVSVSEGCDELVQAASSLQAEFSLRKAYMALLPIEAADPTSYLGNL